MNHPVVKLLVLLLIIFICALLGSVIIVGISMANGLSLNDLISNGNDFSYMSPNMTRLLLLTNHLTTFIIPAFLFAFYYYRKNILRYFRLDKTPNVMLLMLGIIAIFAALPLVQFSFQINQDIPLPDWATSMEAETAKTLENIMTMNGIGDLLFNVFLIGIIPAIGEELIFRGIIQVQLEKIWGALAGIILSAIIFSAIHMQFEGFLPRFTLGVLLACLYYWTRSLWVPIVAHLINNASQVIMLYVSDDFNIEDINSAPDTNILWVLLSSAGMIAIYYAIRQIRPKALDLEEEEILAREENEMNV